METSPYYAADLGLYFTGRPLELALYEALFHAMDTAFPNGRVKVQKSQISFYGRHLFAAASLPVRRKKDWPEHCLLVTFGLEYPLSPPPHCGGHRAIPQPLDPPCGGCPAGGRGRGTAGLAGGDLDLF